MRLEKQARSVIATLEDMDGASLEQLQHAERTLNAEMRKTPQNTEHFKELAGTLQQVKTRIAAIRSKVKSTYKEQEKLVHTIDLYDEEIKKVNKDISVTDRETRLINDTLKHLDKSSVRDIEYSIKILNENLKGVVNCLKSFYFAVSKTT